jgi:hypothetical protein
MLNLKDSFNCTGSLSNPKDPIKIDLITQINEDGLLGLKFCHLALLDS